MNSPDDSRDEPDGQLEVVLARAGLVLQVPAERSILEVVLDSGIDVMYSCEAGICGSCITRVLSGRPDHRDSVLTDEERAGGEVMTLCVSRAFDQRIELDL